MAKKNLKKSKKVVISREKPGVGITPLGDRVLVRPLEADTSRTASGIYIPDSSKKEMPERGIVVAVGEGKRSESGVLVPVHVSVGDSVLFSKYGFDEVQIDNQTFYLVSEGGILAIMR